MFLTFRGPWSKKVVNHCSIFMHTRDIATKLPFPTSCLDNDSALYLFKFISVFCYVKKLFPFPSLSCKAVPRKREHFLCFVFFVSEDFHFFIVTCNTSFLSFLTRYSSVSPYLSLSNLCIERKKVVRWNLSDKCLIGSSGIDSEKTVFKPFGSKLK